jgi:hypothetical protein
MTGRSPSRPSARKRVMKGGRVSESRQAEAAPPLAEERRRAATRKLFARLRSLEAILAADLRKRGKLPLSQAVDHWYAEAANPAATDASIVNAARAVVARN